MTGMVTVTGHWRGLSRDMFERGGGEFVLLYLLMNQTECRGWRLRSGNAQKRGMMRMGRGMVMEGRARE